MTKSKASDTLTAGVKLALRSKAVNQLIEAHADEFHDLMGKEFSEAGYLYERPMTEEEKAKAEVAALVEKYGYGVLPNEPVEFHPVVVRDGRHPADIPVDEINGDGSAFDVTPGVDEGMRPS